MRLLLLLFPLVIHAFPVPRLPFDPACYPCNKTPQPPVCDGRLEDTVWELAPWSEHFGDIEGDLKPAPFRDTRMKMLWDDHALYVAAWMEEPDIWATYDKRDMVIYHENDIELFIDPDGDNHDYFELEVNAMGTEWDLYLTRPYRDNADALDHWDMHGMRSAVHLMGTLNDPADRDSCWTIEVELPWSAIRQGGHEEMPPKDGEQWRMNFSRVQYHLDVVDGVYHKRKDGEGSNLPEFNWTWSPQGLIAMHYPERWGIVEFRSTVSEDPVVAAEHWFAREWLMQAYYAQRGYEEVHGIWAADMDDLELPEGLPGGWQSTTLETGSRGFDLTIHKEKVWLSVNEQSRITAGGNAK
jgi:hypothetical protein